MKMIIVVLLLAAFHASAQDAVSSYGNDASPANTFSLDILSPLNFNYGSTAELFQPKIIPGAIRLNMKVKQETVGVFGQVTFYTMMPSAFLNKMTLRMKYTDSPNASAPSGDVTLTENPQLLLTQPGGFRSAKHFKYLFDLKLNPPDTFNGLQNQNYTITYTISVL